MVPKLISGPLGCSSMNCFMAKHPSRTARPRMSWSITCPYPSDGANSRQNSPIRSRKSSSNVWRSMRLNVLQHLTWRNCHISVEDSVSVLPNTSPKKIVSSIHTNYSIIGLLPSIVKHWACPACVVRTIFMIREESTGLELKIRSSRRE